VSSTVCLKSSEVFFGALKSSDGPLESSRELIGELSVSPRTPWSPEAGRTLIEAAALPFVEVAGGLNVDKRCRFKL
jgi:hypothetical protein